MSRQEHPHLIDGRRVLPLAVEVQAAFAAAARAWALTRGEQPSLRHLQVLLGDRELQLRLLPCAAAKGPLADDLPDETARWFRGEFQPRPSEERDLMVSLASAMLAAPYLGREAEEALGTKPVLFAPGRVARIVAALALAGLLLPAALFFAVLPLLPEAARAAFPLLSGLLLIAAVIPAARYAASLGVYDFRPGSAGRYAAPALLLLCLAAYSFGALRYLCLLAGSFPWWPHP